MSKIRLAIVCTHPIQYYAPVFRALAQSNSLVPKVFYTWSQAGEGATYDREFGARFSWDVPLLVGYEYEFVDNSAKNPTTKNFFGVKTPTLWPRIRSWRSDAVLVFGWNLHAHLQVMRLAKDKLPVLFRGDSTLLNPIKPVRRIARRLFLRWVYSHVDVAIAVGSNSEDYFRWCGLTTRQVAFAPHSVDTLRFGDPTGEHEKRASEWRIELGISADSPVVLFAGKFTPTKDTLLLLDATARLRTGAHLVLVGSGELEQQMRSAAVGRPNVHFLPFKNQSEMPSVYRLADVVVLPSLSETWGLVINEAMASGRPAIVSSRVGCARDLIRDGETGWIFDAGSLDGLTAALQTATVAGRDGLRAMGERASTMIAGWSTEEAARGIEDAVLQTTLRFKDEASVAVS